ncbi:MAG: 1,4-beta-xylanase [Candidatus Brocadiaceae bacterium]|nr:1,4-beta-xylanase [Candidatus Brocadiaceae bacterium]
MKPSGRYFEVVVFASDGKPAPYTPQNLIMVLDMDFMPAFEHRPMIIVSGYGLVRLPAPDGPFAVCMPLAVDGFGHVYLYADNEGRGYAADEVAGRRLNLSVEFATSRLAAVRRAETEYRKEGTVPSADYRDRVHRAAVLLDRMRNEEDDPVAEARLAMASLAESMHAGEMLVLEHARARIAARPARSDFLFGCNGFRYPRGEAQYAQRFAALFNYVTAPFYRRGTEPTEGLRDFSNAEAIAAWGAREGLRVKGHPLLWLHHAGTPDWLMGRSHDEVLATHLDYVRDAVARFRGRIDYWDIINEAHSWNNIHCWPYEQLVDITRRAAETVAEVNPDALRVVNCCFTWSEYVATGWGSDYKFDEPMRSTMQYCRDVLDAGVPFEAIGLQMYEPPRDMFEINRHIDMFCRLGKRVHITELGISSSPEPIVRRKQVYVPNEMLWHGRPWSEAEQADWIEAFYTLCYSKPEVDAVTWWDFADPCFLPHGGMLTEDLQPKESYGRLKALIDGWRGRDDG